jgi:hypothetical protein
VSVRWIRWSAKPFGSILRRRNKSSKKLPDWTLCRIMLYYVMYASLFVCSLHLHHLLCVWLLWLLEHIDWNRSSMSVSRTSNGERLTEKIIEFYEAIFIKAHPLFSKF